MEGLFLVGGFSKKGDVTLFAHPSTLERTEKVSKLALPRSTTDVDRSTLVFTVDDTTFVSFPVFVGNPWLLGTSSATASSSSSVDVDSVLGFSIVLVAPSSTPLEPLRSSAQRIGECLLLLDQLDGSVSKELLDLTSQQQQSKTNTNMIGGGGGSGNVGGNSSATSAANSPPFLIPLLTHIADQLCNTGSVHVTNQMPHGLPLSLTLLPSTTTTTTNRKASPSPGSRSNHSIAESPPIRPFHALLLLADTEQIISQLPPDASPQLLVAIRKSSPTRSLHEIQAETGVAASELLRLAGHLVYHRLATIIDCISEESRYSVAPDAAPMLTDEQEFALLSPTGTLRSFLSLFSKIAAEGLPLRSLMIDMTPASRGTFVQSLAWLLKKKYIRQQHIYVHALWPWVLRSRMTMRTKNLGVEGETEVDENYDSSPQSAWQSDELEFAAHLCRDKSSEMQDLFMRILVYLRDVHLSRHHDDDSNSSDRSSSSSSASLLACRVEELMYRLRVSRQHILDTCRIFSPYLCLQQGE